MFILRKNFKAGAEETCAQVFGNSAFDICVIISLGNFFAQRPQIFWVYFEASLFKLTYLYDLSSYWLSAQESTVKLKSNCLTLLLKICKSWHVLASVLFFHDREWLDLLKAWNKWNFIWPEPDCFKVTFISKYERQPSEINSSISIQKSHLLEEGKFLCGPVLKVELIVIIKYWQSSLFNQLSEACWEIFYKFQRNDLCKHDKYLNQLWTRI